MHSKPHFQGSGTTNHENSAHVTGYSKKRGRHAVPLHGGTPPHHCGTGVPRSRPF